jgi:2,3-bisphosphoglycerate-dependent phosphoglycerate mutase
MQTEIYFIRHAEPNYNNHDDLTRELTKKGLVDRELVTNYLSDKNIEIVLSSPYKRAVDTVKHFADKNNMIIEQVEDFKERKIDSCWIEDFESFSKSQWSDFTYKLSDGECLNEVKIRNISALQNILKTHIGKKIIIGSHGTALSTIINYYDNSFGYDDFVSIKNLMPWIVKFIFEGDACIKIEKINLFAL